MTSVKINNNIMVSEFSLKEINELDILLKSLPKDVFFFKYIRRKYIFELVDINLYCF